MHSVCVSFLSLYQCIFAVRAGAWKALRTLAHRGRDPVSNTHSHAHTHPHTVTYHTGSLQAFNYTLVISGSYHQPYSAVLNNGEHGNDGRGEGHWQTNGGLNLHFIVPFVDKTDRWRISERCWFYTYKQLWFLSFFPQTKKGPPVKQQGGDGAQSAAYCYNCSKKGHFGYVSILIFVLPGWISIVL